MINLLTHWLISATFLYVLSILFSGIVIEGAFAAIVSAIILALVNATIKPLLQIISIPITVFTLGIFYFIVNGFVLYLVSWIVSGFTIASFWTAFWAAIVLSLLNAVFVKRPKVVIKKNDFDL